MSNIAIKVENLGKKYVINHENGNSDDNFREVIIGTTKKILAKVNPFVKKSKEETSTEDFWALNDVNFTINKGDKIGIIGRNGAGKSTLLKVLSRITEPTTGKIHINGRIASLLEVGTGFHPELTGRENIYLNGAILGMNRMEIKAKFDEIVAFAEVDKFLDTPVKRYSSGMYVRLAFSVAAHLEPEILIVDEVLAVGDAAFQKKCLGKMDDVSKEGRTIVFVSHNMPMIASLCNKGIYMNKGKLIYTGTIQECIGHYYSNDQAVQGKIDYTKERALPGDHEAKLLEASICDATGSIKADVEISSEVHINMKYELLKDEMSVYPNFHIFNSEGVCVFITSDSKLDSKLMLKKEKGQYVSTCIIPANYFNDGTYFIGLALTSTKPTTHVHFYEKDALQLLVSDKIEGTITRNGYAGPIPGVIRPSLDWRCEKL
jgi:lipopolysaccharide transport system ATP-binding protein